MKIPLASALLTSVMALDDGLARTPPMGWMSWERFLCNGEYFMELLRRIQGTRRVSSSPPSPPPLPTVDCDTYPDSCISENLYKRTADLMASEGYLDAGYDQVNIDDCWSTLERDPVTNEQVADPGRFPSGIKNLAAYVHDKGLKLGLYSDIGTKTCGGYIGMQDNLELDANTFASWDIDMLKVDGCYQDTDMMKDTYPELSRALNATGRPIVYSCSWPAYLPEFGEANDGEVLKELAEICHMWRNWDDIRDDWGSVSSVIDYWKRNTTEDIFVSVAGPGHWNDPDQLMIGDNGLSHSQERSQFALWAIFAAPLFMSNDLAHISKESKEILLNKEIIAIDQDPAGHQGILNWSSEGNGDGDVYGGETRVWSRLLNDGSYAVVLQSTHSMGTQTKVKFESSMLDGWEVGQKFVARDLYLHEDIGEFDGEMVADVWPGDVEMFIVDLV